MTATHDTLHTGELLEQILINVEVVRTLLLSQRVSRYWRALISTSPYLQKKLFLKPATTQDIITLGIAPASSAKAPGNPSIEMVCPYISPSKSSSDYAVLNPLLIYVDLWKGLDKHLLTWASPPRQISKSNVTPSWRNMVLMQPPRFESIPGKGWVDGETLSADCRLGRAFDKVSKLRSPRNSKFTGHIWPRATCVSPEEFWQTVEAERAAKVDGKVDEKENVKVDEKGHGKDDEGDD